MTVPLAITGWSAVSAAGTSAADFSEAVRADQAGIRVGGAEQQGPTGAVPGFDIRELLGRKNTRTMDRITGLTVLTVGRLLEQQRLDGHHVDGSGTGLVLGTTTGSVQSMMDFTLDSFIQDRPYMVDPARFPNAVMNCAAGQSAIWHGLRGPNTTIASGHIAGLSVLRYAARLHQAGHARSLLCGAVEELTPQRIWLEKQRAETTVAAALGEGCAIFRMEPLDDATAAGRMPLAHLVATAFRVCASAADSSTAIAACAAAVMKSANAQADDVWAIAADVSDALHDRLVEVVGGNTRRVCLPEFFGDTGAASAALHVAATLSLAQVDPAACARLALVASIDREGSVGVGALRLADGPR